MEELKNEIAENIVRMRISQTMVNERYKRNEFKIPIHLALGHEAIAAAVDAVMGVHDSLVLHHRNIHYNLARTKKLKPVLDEYYLKKEGLAKGRLGSMNLANENAAIIYTSSILGNNLGVAAGLSLSKKVLSSNGLVVVTTGDGSIEEGAFYESLLFAKSNALPILYIIENNGWSLATRIEERRCPIDLDGYARSLGAHYAKLDGNEVFSYIDRLEQLRDKALSENAPVCVEVELTTLGHWIMEKEGYSKGKFINYHAGPAPTVNLDAGPVLQATKEDPVFVLQKRIGNESFSDLSGRILQELNEEVI